MKRLLLLSCLIPGLLAHSQDQGNQASVGATIGPDGAGKIIVEATGQLPEPAVFYSADVTNTATVSPDGISQTVKTHVRILQGSPKRISFLLRGNGDVRSVEGATVATWAVRHDKENRRFLDLTLNAAEKPVDKHEFEIQLQSEIAELPASPEVTHLSPADSETAGFSQTLSVTFAIGVSGRVVEADGFLPVEANADGAERFQTSTGGKLTLSLNRVGATPAPVELTQFRLSGSFDPDGNSGTFQLKGIAEVSQAGASIPILSGQVAVGSLSDEDSYRLQLGSVAADGPRYLLTFPKEGTFPITVNFVARITRDQGWNKTHFTVATGAVAPLALKGLPGTIEFRPDSSVMPAREDDSRADWIAFLPANGNCLLSWKESRTSGKGKLFFSTTAQIETTVGAGLLRQAHRIDYQILQGELDQLVLTLDGPGEVLSAEGTQVVGWAVEEAEGNRVLRVRLSRALSETGQLTIQTQQPLDAFPVRVTGLRITPVETVRHSGFLRVTNRGSVRLELTDLEGMTQLAPEQYPGAAIEARQIFAYRFPAADYAFSVAADRIQPEVSVSELVLYRLAETDRVISADIELDIREAPIREFDIGIPEDYSVVAVTGANVSDYVVASQAEGGQVNLKTIFGSDVTGRQLISLHLERNVAASAGEWVLPSLSYPEAESVRGDIGVTGTPGFRIAVGETDLLTDKPLSYFPKQVPHLQQAFRIREPGWSATMQIEVLEESIQADVFHLYSLSEGTAYGSVLLNYFITGAPVSELRLFVPEDLGNLSAEGKDVRTFRQEEDALVISLHQPVIGPYTLLVTFEEKVDVEGGSLEPGRVFPLDVQGERGFLQIVSPMQVQTSVATASEDLLRLDALELPAEFRLLTAAPSLGAWQYTERPFELSIGVNWFEPGNTVTQVVEFSEIRSRISGDGELVSDILYYIKSREHRVLRLQLPDGVRLWEVKVAGNSVNARQADQFTLVPLPGGTDPNQPVEVRLRIGRPAIDGNRPLVSLPRVDAPVLKTEWHLEGTENQILVPAGGTVQPPYPVLSPSGFTWITRHGLGSILLILLLATPGFWLSNRSGIARPFGLAFLLAATIAAGSSAVWASSVRSTPAPLQISLPSLTPGESVEVIVRNLPIWQANLSWLGILLCLAGAACLVFSFARRAGSSQPLWLAAGSTALFLGILLQRESAPWFFALVAVLLLVLVLFPRTRNWYQDFREKRRTKKKAKLNRKASKSSPDSEGPAAGPATASILLAGLLLGCFTSQAGANDVIPAGFVPADSIHQEWAIDHETGRLEASGEFTVAGKPGDSFLLLRAPAILTEFEGEGLRITRQEQKGLGRCYVLTIPVPDEPAPSTDDPFTEDPFRDLVAEPAPEPALATFSGRFSFHLEVTDLDKGFLLPTGPSAVQEIDASYNRPGWIFSSPAAIRVRPTDAANDVSAANLLLTPHAKATIQLRPKPRDVTSEETQFFVESSHLYISGPGVIDGRHEIEIRPAQGQVRSLRVRIPAPLTVSEVTGPVSSWQFDADSRTLGIEIEPAQASPFSLRIDTQRGLDPLPSEAELEPLMVEGSDGEVGLVGLAFAADAQPERVESDSLSTVNLGDFDAKHMPSETTVLHRVYRYGSEGGTLSLRVAPVAPEVRVTSKQVLSLGEERVVLGVNFSAEITRSGLFQLSFPLPDGYEVESLSGASLHHWAELSEGDSRQIVLHLNGKTLGTQTFSLSLTSASPEDIDEWTLPRFELNEASRQTGDLIVRPTTGIRLRTLTRQNVSEVDPRTLGGDTRGALAFRLLQRDWDLSLGVEKLDPWVTGEALHEIVLREGQTKTILFARFRVENASIQGLQVQLPIDSEEEIKTLVASGKSVSDLVRTAPDSNLWEIRFKRRVVGELDVRIEYERRGERTDDTETLSPASFPDARQLTYYFAVRSGGRLEVEPGELTRGWQRADWNSVPKALRQSGTQTAPVLTLRTVSPDEDFTIHARRHSLAEALKLRVASGTLTSVLSPLGDQLTAVDLTMEVIQRSSLIIGLPESGELFSIFVNGESVHSVRQGEAWHFYILPGADDRTASVRFVYSVPGDQLRNVQLFSPQLNVPLENVTWNVVAPKGYLLASKGGTMELKDQRRWQAFDRESYLSKAKGQRRAQAEQAADLLEQANDLLQKGEQSKARWALNSVANQFALDAASNEDARVQLENLQTQQAVVGLNTRRQRLFLDNPAEESAAAGNAQIQAGITENRVLQQGDLNYRPQELSQILQGNTSEDNAALQRIATRLVQHQRSTTPPPQAISITLPEEGTAYTFHRTVQVAENAPLQLELTFAKATKLGFWKSIAAALLLLITGFGVAVAMRRK